MLRFTKQTIVCLVLAVIALLCQAGTPSEKFVNAGKRVLVIVDSLDIRDTHSQFFKQLEQRGYSLKFQRAKDSSITLTQYGEYLFDNLILFTPQTENFGGELNTKNIQEFIEAGHNVLIASTTKLPDSLREVATDLGVEFDADDTNVIDHFNFDSTLDRQYGRTHTVVAAKHFVSSPVVLGKALSRTPVLFYGYVQ
jgi:oligosaccharyltransferase complex subunit beta